MRNIKLWILAVTLFATIGLAPTLLRANFDRHDWRGGAVAIFIFAACICSFLWLRHQPTRNQ